MSTCFYFVHIVKTGGSSFRDFFSQDIPISFYANDGSGHNSFSKETFNRLSNEYDKVITGICLRDPVKQMASFYSYIKLHPTSVIYKTVGRKTFSEWIRSVPNFKNYYVRFLNFNEYYDPNSIDNLEGTKCDFKEAKELLNSIDYVMDTSFLSRDMSKLLKDNNIDIKFNIHSNASESGRMNISSEDVKYIKDIRSEDYKLLKEFNIKLHY